MSRYGGPRRHDDDLAYGDEPQRWDRERFERMRLNERPAARENVRVIERERIDERSPRGRYEERDFYEEERYTPPARNTQQRHRRSDRELFGEEDPRLVAERALAPYRREVDTQQDVVLDIERRRVSAPRPGLLRRQSSLDTFDRRPQPRYDREDHRLPANVDIPLPRREPARRAFREEDFDGRYRDPEPQDYREVEIYRERDVRRRSRAKSDVKSVRSEAKSHRSRAKSHKSSARSVTTARSSSSSSSSSETVQEYIREESPGNDRKIGKKGRTRMPKRLVRKEVVYNLDYPFEEEEDFIVVRRALGKDEIDEVIRLSEEYRQPKTMTYRYDNNGVAAPEGSHYEALRTEWINPPTIRGAPSVRAPSPARTHRTRRSSPARTMRATSAVRAPQPPAPQQIIIEDRRSPIQVMQAPAPPPQIVHTHAPAPPSQPAQPMTIVVPERRERSDRDINSEIRALELEQRALRVERETDRREIVVRRPEDNYELVEYRPRRETLEVEEREPRRDTVRVEKDRKARRRARSVAAAMATLT